MNRRFLVLGRERMPNQASKEFCAQLRHSRAEALLLGDRLSIKEIAAQLGFHFPAHFSVEFKKRSGHSPSNWLRAQ